MRKTGKTEVEEVKRIESAIESKNGLELQ